LYAVLRELGRDGISDLVDRCCERARQFAAGVAQLPGARGLNEVVLNQVLFQLGVPAGRDPDVLHGAVAAVVQADGRCWIGTTRWQGEYRAARFGHEPVDNGEKHCRDASGRA
jgi:glutamate/tyrosine decarboxylase-like PLP-dependent enzyme